jgi:DNA invertase Pin-like site-specific DNA recombinase
MIVGAQAYLREPGDVLIVTRLDRLALVTSTADSRLVLIHC